MFSVVFNISLLSGIIKIYSHLFVADMFLFFYFCTDQCAAMAKAMHNVLPNTRHRWCRWHVLKGAKERLGNVYSKHKKFKRLFNTLVTDEIDISRFEKEWTCLLRKFKLLKNKYLKRLFKYRHKWAKPYFMNVFCAGMTSTQRSESGNHISSVSF